MKPSEIILVLEYAHRLLMECADNGHYPKSALRENEGCGFGPITRAIAHCKHEAGAELPQQQLSIGNRVLYFSNKYNGLTYAEVEELPGSGTDTYKLRLIGMGPTEYEVVPLTKVYGRIVEPKGDHYTAGDIAAYATPGGCSYGVVGADSPAITQHICIFGIRGKEEIHLDSVLGLFTPINPDQ